MATPITEKCRGHPSRKKGTGTEPATFLRGFGIFGGTVSLAAGGIEPVPIFHLPAEIVEDDVFFLDAQIV